jgi:hypothetical protein
MCMKPQLVKACDGCGSAVNASYFGILPQFKQHFVGVRYLNTTFNSKPLPSLFAGNTDDYKEVLQRTELYARYYPTNRIQIFAFLPYQYNLKKEPTQTTKNHGFSDASVLVNYIVVNTGDSGSYKWRNTLSVGGGLKLPTGKYNTNELASQQTGTGTLDFLLNAIYTLRYKKVGLNMDANVRINTSNTTYLYGNRYASSTRFFYWHKYKMLSALPHTGFLVEYGHKDQKHHITQKYTGGQGLYSTTGVDLYYKKWAAGASFTLPITERVNEGYAKTIVRFSTQLIYMF